MTPLAHDPAHTSRLAREICGAWLDGAPPDTRAALAEHPELEEDRSALAELAYEEYCLRRQAGEALDLDSFCARFPAVQSFLRRILAADQALAEHESIVAQRPMADVAWPLPGDEIAGCRLVRELGRGAFARVYLATEHSAGDRPVVLKLSQLGGGEARMLGRLHHDHVVSILWAESLPDLGVTAVCMPFQGSATFADLLDRFYPQPGSPPPQRAGAILDAIQSVAHQNDPAPDMYLPGPSLAEVDYVEGVRRLACVLAEGLAFLHERGLYHCDLKPSNLLLTPLGRPLLLDFNLSQVAGNSAGIIGGTYAYMAPEVLRGHAERRPQAIQNAQTDLFSLGVVLYEMLTGRLPFGAPPSDLAINEVPGWLLARMAAGAIPADRLNPEVPRRLSEVIQACLALDPRARPGSARELREHLEPRSTSRGRRRAMVGAVLGVGVVAAALVMMPRLQTPSVEPEPSDEMARQQQAASQSLERGRVLLTAGKREEAQVQLREAADQFRKILEQHQTRPEPRPGAWKDHLHQAHALILLDQPEDARTVARRADDLWRLEVARLAMMAIPTPLAPPALGGAAMTWTMLESPQMGGIIAACRSHCCSRLGDHAAAQALGERAMDQGVRSAALLNNLGYSALQQGKLDAAQRYLTEARRIAPDNGAILFNACRLGQRKLLRTRGPVPTHLVQDIDRAVQQLQHQHGESAELYQMASAIYARATRELKQSLRGAGTVEQVAEVRRREQTLLEYLRRGCVLGLDVEAQLRDPMLQAALGDLLRRERLEGQRQQTAMAVVSSYLSDPLDLPRR